MRKKRRIKMKRRKRKRRNLILMIFKREIISNLKIKRHSTSDTV
jgi:hypothetical protein